MNWNNALTQVLEVTYPIVQAPMLGVTTPQMVAAVSGTGALGSLPVGGLSPQTTRDLIRKTKSLTSKPFAVNLFVYPEPVADLEKAERMQDFLESFCASRQIPYDRLPASGFVFHSYKKQIEILLEEKVSIVSFTFGIPDEESIAALKNAGCVLIGTATSVKEAVLLKENGADAITAQGIEAGGHRGSFAESTLLPAVGVFSLVPQIVQQVKLPVLAAGGIYNGAAIRAALALGASGVQLGTAFIASHESSAFPAYKQSLLQTSDTDVVLTKAFSGRWARGIQNELMQAIDHSGIEIPAYPWQSLLMAGIRAWAQKENQPAFTNLWAGQSAIFAQEKPAADIVTQLISQTEKTDY